MLNKNLLSLCCTLALLYCPLRTGHQKKNNTLKIAFNTEAKLCATCDATKTKKVEQNGKIQIKKQTKTGSTKLTFLNISR